MKKIKENKFIDLLANIKNKFVLGLKGCEKYLRIKGAFCCQTPIT